MANNQTKPSIGRAYGTCPYEGDIANLGTTGAQAVQQCVAGEEIRQGNIITLQDNGNGFSTTSFKAMRASDIASTAGVVIGGGDGLDDKGFALYEDGSIVSYVLLGSGAEVWLRVDAGQTFPNGVGYLNPVTDGKVKVASTLQDKTLKVSVVSQLVNGKRFNPDNNEVVSCKLVLVRL